MPIMDDKLIFQEALSIAGVDTTTTLSTYCVPVSAITDHQGASGYDSPGISRDICLNVVVDSEDFLAAADGSVVTFTLYSDTDTTPTTGGDVVLTYAITVNTAATDTNYLDGKVICSLPLPIMQLKTYLGFKSYVATQTLSTGKVTAYLGPPITNK